MHVQSRHAQDPSPQFIRNYFSAFANDPILTSVSGVEKLEAGTPDGEGNEKEKVEEMEKDAVVTRYILDVCCRHLQNNFMITYLHNLLTVVVLYGLTTTPRNGWMHNSLSNIHHCNFGSYAYIQRMPNKDSKELQQTL